MDDLNNPRQDFVKTYIKFHDDLEIRVINNDL